MLSLNLFLSSPSAFFTLATNFVAESTGEGEVAVGGGSAPPQWMWPLLAISLIGVTWLVVLSHSNVSNRREEYAGRREDHPSFSPYAVPVHHPHHAPFHHESSEHESSEYAPSGHASFQQENAAADVASSGSTPAAQGDPAADRTGEATVEGYSQKSAVSSAGDTSSPGER